MGGGEVILDMKTQGCLPKEAAFDERPEGSEDQALTFFRRRAFLTKRKQQAKRLGGRIILSIFEERQGKQHVRAVPPNTAATSHMCLFTLRVKLIKTEKGKNSVP